MKKYLVYMLLLLLTGCAQHPDVETTPISSQPWQQHKTQLTNLSSWTLTGKLAVFIGKDRQSANLFWQQKNDNYQIELTSFIGTRILSIHKDNQGVTLVNNDGETFTGEDTESLLNKLAPQLSLPVSSLQQWIKGNPINASYQLNEQQLVSELLGKDKQEKFWAVNYQQYRSVKDIILPSKLEMKQGQIRIKIAVNQWQLPQTN